MSKPILEFKGEYYFLSNFYESPMVIDGKTYQTNEHYYQSQKAEDPKEARKIKMASTAGLSKKLGRKCKIRHDWEEVKVDVMRKGLEAKFTHDPDLKQRLLDTGDAYLQEGNTWNDTFWGVDLKSGNGKNMLGKLLMEIRTKVQML